MGVDPTLVPFSVWAIVGGILLMVAASITDMALTAYREGKRGR